MEDYQLSHQIHHFHWWYRSIQQANGRADETWANHHIFCLLKLLTQRAFCSTGHQDSWGVASVLSWLDDRFQDLRFVLTVPSWRHHMYMRPYPFQYGLYLETLLWQTYRHSSSRSLSLVLWHNPPRYYHNGYWNRYLAMGRGQGCPHEDWHQLQQPSSGTGEAWLFPLPPPWYLHHIDYEGWCSCRWSNECWNDICHIVHPILL